MNKGYKIGFGLFLLLLLGLIFLEASEPKPLNLSPSYSGQHKAPLGSYAFFESLKKTKEVVSIATPPFEAFSNKEISEGTYFFLNDQVVFDQAELDALLQWVEQGNTAFIATGYFGKNLLDTLVLNAVTHRGRMDFKTRPALRLHQMAGMETDTFELPFDIEALVFTEMDSAHLELGMAAFTQSNDTLQTRSNFLRTQFGKGVFLLHSTPEAFANYFFLKKDNHRYAEGVMAYLDPSRPVYWDQHHKSGKTYYSTPLYYLLRTRPLKWAYYCLLLGVVLFILFEGKRKQRPIQIIPPLVNRSFDYTRTIADLYLEQKDYRGLTLKKIELFLENIREDYRLSTREINTEFYERLAERSGNSLEATKELVHHIRHLKEKNHITRKEFLDLSRTLEKFKSHSHATSGKRS